MQKSFLQTLLIPALNFFSVVCLIAGLIFSFAFYTGSTKNFEACLLLMTIGSAAAISALIMNRISAAKTNALLREATSLAAKISEGDAEGDFGETNPNDLLGAINGIAVYLKEKAEITDRIAAGNLSGDIHIYSESDVLGNSLRNMIDKLNLLVETEEKRNSLQRSTVKLLSEVKEVASGNLRVKAEVTSEVTGEIANAINFMTGELCSLIGQVKEITFQVISAANAINTTTEQLVHGSEAQAAQITRTTSAVANMAAQVQEISENASLSSQVADDSLNNARFGAKAVQDNISAMNAIRKQVQETAKRIKKLGERSQEIGQIVGLINDLSDRTSLIALNAGLQAAAVEKGRGFAVVAEEIESLAERSNRLTQQIAALAQAIQSETKDVVASMEETIHEVVIGSTLADKAGQALIEIEQVSGRLAALLQSISESATRQAQSSDDISNAMTNISKVTELVNVGSRRAADSVKILVMLSDELRGSVAPFRLPEERKILPPKTSDELQKSYLN